MFFFTTSHLQKMSTVTATGNLLDRDKTLDREQWPSGEHNVAKSNNTLLPNYRWHMDCQKTLIEITVTVFCSKGWKIPKKRSLNWWLKHDKRGPKFLSSLKNAQIRCRLNALYFKKKFHFFNQFVISSNSIKKNYNKLFLIYFVLKNSEGFVKINFDWYKFLWAK